MEVITNPDCWIVRLDVDELLDTSGLMLRLESPQCSSSHWSRDAQLVLSLVSTCT
jgi:hypothetical protein